MQEGFALSYHKKIHAFIFEYMYTLCLKAFAYSFKTFYKLEKTSTTVFCFMSNYKYEKIVCYVCISGVQFEGDLGEILVLGAKISPYFGLREKSPSTKKKNKKKYFFSFHLLSTP